MPLLGRLKECEGLLDGTVHALPPLCGIAPGQGSLFPAVSVSSAGGAAAYTAVVSEAGDFSGR
ncbi:hypothetical protein D3C80_1575800 [compost metagenome]